MLTLALSTIYRPPAHRPQVGNVLALPARERQADVAQRSIEILIGRLITDEAFRTAFCDDAAATLERFMETGHELTPVELAALSATRSDVWSLVAEQIDPRLQKASLASTGH